MAMEASRETQTVSAISQTNKRYGFVPLFRPEDGVTVVQPEGTGSGYWVGAPSVLVDPASSVFYLSYRVRRPRPERGVETRIARSTDGVRFQDVWSLHKSALKSDSIERCALTLGLDGVCRLYIGYVDPEDKRWRTDVIEADSPTDFRTENRRKVFTAADIGAEGVKDPVVYVFGRQYYMILSYAPVVKGRVDQGAMHGTADVFNTGLIKSHTGLAVSDDGVHFEWRGDILSPVSEGWDSYCARISTLIYDPPVFTVFYDGSQHVSENYEERTGLASGVDLYHLERLTPTGPILTSPNGMGALRYLEAVPFESKIYYYYEYTRPDGSHELRLNIVSR